MTPHLTTIRERAEAVEQWSQLHGDEVEVYVREDAVKIIEDALWLAGDVLLLLPLVEGRER